nr:hypothetical protein [Aquibacillus albus]
MFLLSKEDLEGKKILDCPSGACSFSAVGNSLGLDVTACDIAYYHSGEDLRNKGLQDIEHALNRIFPLVDLEGKKYVHLNRIKSHLADKGCIVDEVKVSYEFQTNANSMLKIKKDNKEG